MCARLQLRVPNSALHSDQFHFFLPRRRSMIRRLQPRQLTIQPHLQSSVQPFTTSCLRGKVRKSDVTD